MKKIISKDGKWVQKKCSYCGNEEDIEFIDEGYYVETCTCNKCGKSFTYLALERAEEKRKL